MLRLDGASAEGAIVRETNSGLVSAALALPDATAKPWSPEAKAWTAEVCRLVNERYKELGISKVNSRNVRANSAGSAES